MQPGWQAASSPSLPTWHTHAHRENALAPDSKVPQASELARAPDHIARAQQGELGVQALRRGRWDAGRGRGEEISDGGTIVCVVPVVVHRLNNA